MVHTGAYCHGRGEKREKKKTQTEPSSEAVPIVHRSAMFNFPLLCRFQFQGMMPVDLKYVAGLSTDIIVSLAHAGCIPEKGCDEHSFSNNTGSACHFVRYYFRREHPDSGEVKPRWLVGTLSAATTAAWRIGGMQENSR